MALMPTSITLFLVQIGTFFANIIVAVCVGLYVSSYPKSPDAQPLSPIALGTLAFACLSSLITLLLILRQKSGKTMRAIFESTWIFSAIALWILAAVGGIIRPPNGMSNVSCKVLPDGKETSDSNYIHACQAMFASTAFCIVSALFFIATAIMLSVFSVKSSWRNRKAGKNQVGGHYKLTTTLSQYRRAEKEDEEAKRLKGAGEHEEAATESTSTVNNSAATTTIDLSDGHFSDRVYRDPYTSAMPAALPTTVSSPAPYYSPYGASGSSNNSPARPSSNIGGNANAHLAFLKGEQFKVHNQPREENERQQMQEQQQQQQQYQYQQQQQEQQQQSWSQQQPTFGGY